MLSTTAIHRQFLAEIQAEKLGGVKSAVCWDKDFAFAL
jgi:hypothetical protein